MYLTDKQILEKYSNMTPGKYWSLPSNRRHMLDQMLESKDYYPMIKIDGYWARAIIWEGNVLIQSRGITKATGTYGTYTEQVPHIAKELLNLPNGTVLIGELAFPDLTKKSNDVGSILRSKPPRAISLQEQRGKLEFFIFDILVYEGRELIDLPFEERMSQIDSNYFLDQYKYVSMLDLYKPGTGARLLQDVWNQGGEGIILVKRDLPYKIGNAQAWHSIKVKRSLSELEARVIGTIEPTKYYEGTELETWDYFEDGEGVLFTRERLLRGELIPNGFRAVTKPYYFGRKSGVIVDYEGRIIRISSGITDDDGEFLAGNHAQQLIENGELYAVFTGMELTEDSVRHPSLIRLRDDIKTK